MNIIRNILGLIVAIVAIVAAAGGCANGVVENQTVIGQIELQGASENGSDFVPPQAQVASDNKSTIVTSPSNSIIDSKLIFPNGAPRLNQTAELKLIFIAHIAIARVTMNIELPEGIQFVSGGLSWSGDIPRGGRQEISAMVRPVKTGDYAIHAVYSYPDQPYSAMLASGLKLTTFALISDNSSIWEQADSYCKPSWQPDPPPYYIIDGKAVPMDVKEFFQTLKDIEEKKKSSSVPSAYEREDGCVVNSDGSVLHPDGRLVLPDGTVKITNMRKRK